MAMAGEEDGLQRIGSTQGEPTTIRNQVLDRKAIDELRKAV